MPISASLATQYIQSQFNTRNTYSLCFLAGISAQGTLVYTKETEGGTVDELVGENTKLAISSFKDSENIRPLWRALLVFHHRPVILVCDTLVVRTSANSSDNGYHKD